MGPPIPYRLAQARRNRENDWRSLSFTLGLLMRAFLTAVALTTATFVTPVGAQDAPAARTAELPLKPSRTVKFTTDEGTWMSLDVSPNGQTIVFDLAGDVY